MTAVLPLPLRLNAAPAGICSDHRLVPLRWFGVLKERQHEGRVIGCGRARAPIVGRGSRQAESDKIGGLDGDGGKGLVKHGSLYHQRNIRQSESCTCNIPTIGHNNSMSEPKSFQEKCLSKFSADFEEAADKIAARSKKDPEGKFVIFVDGMDGDVSAGWIAATIAVTHAFRHGATEVVLKRWPEQGNSKSG